MAPGAGDARDITTAVAERQARLQSLEAGATPRALQSVRDVGMGGGPALNQAQIHEIFEFYANFGRSAVMTYQDSLDSFMFMKFARECPGLMDRALTATEVDLIFTKAKPKFERRLDFEHFLDALAAVADRKYPEYSPADGLRLLIANHLAPHYEVVQNEMLKTGDTEVPLSGVYKKLYDVRSYTGVYAERFRTGDGRINGDADNRAGKAFRGNTNTGTDEVIHDISVLMRPNLRSGSMMTSRPVAPGGSPRAAVAASAGGGSSGGSVSPRALGGGAGSSSFRGRASLGGSLTRRVSLSGSSVRSGRAY
jgi:hypothetical protein